MTNRWEDMERQRAEEEREEWERVNSLYASAKEHAYEEIAKVVDEHREDPSRVGGLVVYLVDAAEASKP